MAIECGSEYEFDHFSPWFSVIIAGGSEHVFRSVFRRYRPAMMDAFKKVWAGYKGWFSVYIGCSYECRPMTVKIWTDESYNTLISHF